MKRNKKRKKLIFFDFVTHFGGAQRCTVLLCEQLKQKDEVYVIDAYGVCHDYIEALTKRNIPTHVLLADAKTVYIGHKGKPFKRVWSVIGQSRLLLKLRKQLARRVLQINPDLIWTSSPKALMLLETSPHLQKYPIVLYAHGWYRKSQFSALGRWLIKKADCVLAVSNPTAQALEEWGVSGNKIHVVFNTIDFDDILGSVYKEPFTSLPCRDRDYRILLPGQLLRTKGQHTAVEAAHLLKEKGLDFVMWLAGDVKMGVGNEYYLHLKKIIGDYGLENDVFLLGFRKDVGALMCLSDVIILPTHSEGLPCAVEESMILQRPVISTPVGGITDLITDGETGLIVPVDDAKALAQSIEKLMLDEKMRDRIVKNAYQRMCEKFSLDKHVEAVRSALEDTIKNKQKRHGEAIA